MSYYTQTRLTVSPEKGVKHIPLRAVIADGMGLLDSELDRIVDVSFDVKEEVMKEPLPDGDTIEYVVDTTENWRSIDKDMLFLSKLEKFQDVLFTLWSSGEFTEDLWIRYYRNGKMQKCIAEITYPDYDESLLW